MLRKAPEMMNPVQTSIPQEDGTDRQVIIEPILEKHDHGYRPIGIYKIYKDAFGDETHLFTEPLEIDGPADELPDEQNPVTWVNSCLKTAACSISRDRY